MRIFCLILVLFCGPVLSRAGEVVIDASSMKRATAEVLEPLLSESPRFPGRPFRDRCWWDRMAAHTDVPSAVRLANHHVQRYFASEAWKQRAVRWNSDAFALLDRMLIAEGLENKGRFMPQIRMLTGQLLVADTWIKSYEVGKPLRPEQLRGASVELLTAHLAYLLALTSRLCGDALPPETHAAIRKEVLERVVYPYLEASRQPRVPRGFWWMKVDYNWNPVCHAMILGAGGMLEESRRVRAELFAAVLRNTANYFNGFPDDGYCSEGNGYWIYGFGRYLELAELMYLFTDGKVNLYHGTEKLEAVKRFGWRIQLDGEVYPHYADSLVHTREIDEVALLYFRGKCSEYWPWIERRKKNLPAYSIRVFTLSADLLLAAEAPREKTPELPLVTWFRDGGVLNSRAAKNDSSGFSLSLKAGHNGEFHNHNDVGSFVVALNGEAVLCDPGCPVYLPESHTPRRYESDANNSFGHPVPVLSGMFQAAGRRHGGRIRNPDFSEERTTALIDFGDAYPRESGIRSLTRRFEHDRKKRVILMTDEAVFEEEGTYSSALLSYGPFRKTAPSVWLVGTGKGRLKVEFLSEVPLNFQESGLRYRLNARTQPRRLGYTVPGRGKLFRVTLRITPASEE